MTWKELKVKVNSIPDVNLEDGVEFYLADDKHLTFIEFSDEETNRKQSEFELDELADNTFVLAH